MDKDELKRLINETVANKDLSTRNQVIEIMRIIAPELEKARKWTRVKEIAQASPPCKCPLWGDEREECASEHAGCVFSDVVDALEGEKE